MVSFKITCEKRQRTLLRFNGGHGLTDILESLDGAGSDDEIEPAIETLTMYFTPSRNCEKSEHKASMTVLIKACSVVVMRKVKSAMTMLFTVEK